MDEFYLVEIDGQRYFRVRVTNRSKALSGDDLVSVHGYVDLATAWYDDELNTPGEFVRYLSFYMKWDECCHINFGEEDSGGYLHLCGPDAWERHNQLMTELYQWAAKEIPMRL